jgi:transketolase
MAPHPKIKITPKLLNNLATVAQQSRSTIVDMLTSVNSSHLGCCFSIVDILTVLYHNFLDIDRIKTQDQNRDFFILSKGHGAAALYATLASVGIIPPDMLTKYHRGFLAGHPTRTPAYGIEASTGSLGHGLPMGVGLALAAKNDKRSSHIYVLMGDGECQEGTTWEALTLAARYNLNNLTIIIDANNLQGIDRCSDVMTGSLAEKFEAFGCQSHHVDGHSYQALNNVIASCGQHNCPDVIIAKTTKGKGLSFIEDKLEWHYKSLKPEQYVAAKKECCGETNKE